MLKRKIHIKSYAVLKTKIGNKTKGIMKNMLKLIVENILHIL